MKNFYSTHFLSINTPAFQVCELHFRPEDIGWETSFYDEQTGRRITAKLKNPFLRDGAVPSLLPNCPSYLSSKTQWRESPERKKMRLEENASVIT